MDNAARNNKYDNLCFARKRVVFLQSETKQYQLAFEKLKQARTIQSEYSDSKWLCSAQTYICEIIFQFNEVLYESHCKTIIGLRPEQVTDLLKKYTIHIFNRFVLKTIAGLVKRIRDFLTMYGEYNFQVYLYEKIIIEEFLIFIGIPAEKVKEITCLIKTKNSETSQQRELAHLSTYLVIAQELEDMFRGPLLDEEFVKWFPLRYWSTIGFTIPQRVTEMIVTPYDCLRRETNVVIFKIRRTNLKGPSEKIVRHNVEDDYTITEYRLPDHEIFYQIEKYKELTKEQIRGTLFVFKDEKTESLMESKDINTLIQEFMNSYIIGNPKYDFVRFASGLEEFDYVNAGDARPIALVNLFYQDFGGEVCRQLAGHEHLDTTAFYYTNIKNTIEASSIMSIQKQMNRGTTNLKALMLQVSNRSKLNPDGHQQGCRSQRRPFDTGDIKDCLDNNCCEDCFGCRYYTPTERDLIIEIEKREKKLRSAISGLIMSIDAEPKAQSDDFCSAILETHTAIARLSRASDSKVREQAKKWVEDQSIVMND
ncbi:MAG: hypothetical protein E7298_14285 [Lachnospiraceae bacterium]|nr:hypothetical protein [Lachnospiraceae bacterium]